LDDDFEFVATITAAILSSRLYCTAAFELELSCKETSSGRDV
jgi:hypothetical protein